jgi:UDP-N-acetylglucosamine 2-epimerase (non-hydrolysing)
MITLLTVVGARRNFMKIAPIIDELKKDEPKRLPAIEQPGALRQHYDELLSGNSFPDSGLTKPDVNLAAGSGSHAVQTAEVMKRIEPVLLDYRPQMVLVVGT